MQSSRVVYFALLKQTGILSTLKKSHCYVNTYSGFTSSFHLSLMRFSFSLPACNSLFSVFPLSLCLSSVPWACSQPCCLSVCVWDVTGFSGLPGLLQDVSGPLKSGCRCQSNFPLFVIFPPFYYPVPQHLHV